MTCRAAVDLMWAGPVDQHDLASSWLVRNPCFFLNLLNQEETHLFGLCVLLVVLLFLVIILVIVIAAVIMFFRGCRLGDGSLGRPPGLQSAKDIVGPFKKHLYNMVGRTLFCLLVLRCIH